MPPKTGTKHRILEILRRGGPMTAENLAGELKLSPVAIRRHLGDLEKAGSVSHKVHREGVGRPTHRYNLTPAADKYFPKGYGNFALEVLRATTEVAGPATVNKVFQKWTDQRIIEYEQQLAGKTLSERIDQLARYRDRDGYMATAERVRDGLWELTEHNCTITTLALEFPEICKEEQRLFQNSLGEEAHLNRIECIASGGRVCRYLIQTKT